jgi:two-component system LytT family response regulator
MARLKALIVDDEPLARERLRGMLRLEPDLEVIGECTDGHEALTAIRFGLPDVVFLDIQMPGCDGLQVVAQLPEADRPAIIYTTAHEEFALAAFDVAAVDYLLKPFDQERLAGAIRRVSALQRNRRGSAAGLPAGSAPGAGRLAFRANGSIVFLRCGEIRWAEADDNYVTLHLTHGRVMIRETLAAIEIRLGPESFARVNRSAVVHLDQIREIQPALHGDHVVVLRDGTRLPLSRGLRGQFGKIAGGG